MTGASAETALGRIEVAIARIEAAATAVQGMSADLGTRNARLRAAVESSVRQLDDLIARQPSAQETHPFPPTSTGSPEA